VFGSQLGQTHLLVLAIGIVAVALLLSGERLLPGRPVALAVVALSIVVATLLGMPALGVPITGGIPPGLPSFAGPALRLRDVEGIVPLAAGCLLLAYIEGVSAARAFAAKHGLRSTRARSSSASAPPTSRRRSDMATMQFSVPVIALVNHSISARTSAGALSDCHCRQNFR
jgi:Sulfate permease family